MWTLLIFCWRFLIGWHSIVRSTSAACGVNATLPGGLARQHGRYRQCWAALVGSRPGWMTVPCPVGPSRVVLWTVGSRVVGYRGGAREERAAMRLRPGIGPGWDWRRGASPRYYRESS
jgi:hypothetical protein